MPSADHAQASLYRRARYRVWFLLFASKGIGKAVDAFIIGLIGLNVLVVIMESEAEIALRYEAAFHVFDVFSSLFFTLEYVLRAWVCVEDPRYARPIKGRLRYSITGMAIIDLVAILPFWLPMFIEMDMRFVRALRLFRLFRLFKIGRYAHAVTALARVFARKKEQLSMTFFTVTLVLILFSSLMYFVEHEAQPDKFTSITQTMWWAAATLTTVGYGDLYPVTGVGQLLGGLIAFTGVIIIALPAGIVASGFAEELADRHRDLESAKEEAQREERERAAASRPAPIVAEHSFGACPHCGKALRLVVDAEVDAKVSSS